MIFLFIVVGLAVLIICFQNHITVWFNNVTALLYIQVNKHLDASTADKAAARANRHRDKEQERERRTRLANLLLRINKAAKRGEASTTYPRTSLTTEMREYLLKRDFVLLEGRFDVVIKWK